MLKKPSFAIKEKKEKKEKKDKKDKTDEAKVSSQFGKDLEELASIQGEAIPNVVQDSIAYLEKFGNKSHKLC